MELLIHITLAFISIFYSSFMAFNPSEKKLNITYIFSLATLVSGTALGFDKDTNITQACLSGVVYLGFIVITIVIARRKLSPVHA